jgi:hypothetical protein
MICSFLSYQIIAFNVVPEWRIMVHLTINLLPYFLLVVATHLFSLCSNCFLSSHFTIDCNVHTIRSETTPINKQPTNSPFLVQCNVLAQKYVLFLCFVFKNGLNLRFLCEAIRIVKCEQTTCVSTPLVKPTK